MFVPAHSPLFDKSAIHPDDLTGMSVITATDDFNQSRIGKWLGNYKEQVNIVATANLPYNEAVLAQENIGVMLSIESNCTYENLRVYPPISHFGGCNRLGVAKGPNIFCHNLCLYRFRSTILKKHIC